MSTKTMDAILAREARLHPKPKAAKKAKSEKVESPVIEITDGAPPEDYAS